MRFANQMIPKSVLSFTSRCIVKDRIRKHVVETISYFKFLLLIDNQRTLDLREILPNGLSYPVLQAWRSNLESESDADTRIYGHEKWPTDVIANLRENRYRLAVHQTNSLSSSERSGGVGVHRWRRC